MEKDHDSAIFSSLNILVKFFQDWGLSPLAPMFSELKITEFSEDLCTP